MQADRFTVKSQEALAAAQRLAGARRNPEVAPGHVLAALLEQDGGIVVPVLRRAGADPERVRRRANEVLDALPTVSGDASAAPALGSEAIELLKRADDEARGMGDEYVSTEHLLLALAADPQVDTGASRDQLADAVRSVRGPHRVTDQNPEDKYQALERFGRDLTEQAEQGKLDPVIGRDDEIRRVVQVLSRRTKNNPVLIGEPGTGKTAIVEGGAAEGAVDAANLLKPMLSRGELRCVGATTLDEYRKHIEKDAALERRFQPIFVGEPSVSDTIAILRGLKDAYEGHHGVRIRDAALVAAAMLSNRYITDRFLPDKAIDLVDEAASRLKMETESSPVELDEAERRVRQLEIELAAMGKESKERREPVERELAEAKARRDELAARWAREKEALD